MDAADNEPGGTAGLGSTVNATPASASTDSDSGGSSGTSILWIVLGIALVAALAYVLVRWLRQTGRLGGRPVGTPQ
jgi:hypothetical protein